MPMGRIHDRITLWGLPLVVTITLLITRDSTIVLILSASYLVGGLILGPDLDIHSRPYKRWGWLRWIWLPYQRTIPHRSVLSHGPLIGTTLRILYLLTVATSFSLLGLLIWAYLHDRKMWGLAFLDRLNTMTTAFLQLIHHYPFELGTAYLGLEIGAMSHSISDWLGSTMKRLRRKSKTQKRSR